MICFFIKLSHSHDPSCKFWLAFLICWVFFLSFWWFPFLFLISCLYVEFVWNWASIFFLILFFINIFRCQDLGCIFGMLSRDGTCQFFFYYYFVRSHLIDWNLSLATFFYLSFSNLSLGFFFNIYQITIAICFFYYWIKLYLFFFFNSMESISWVVLFFSFFKTPWATNLVTFDVNMYESDCLSI